MVSGQNRCFQKQTEITSLCVILLYLCRHLAAVKYKDLLVMLVPTLEIQIRRSFERISLLDLSQPD